MIDDAPLRALAATQHGLVSFEQARSAGFGTDQRWRLVDDRRWIRRSGRVLQLVGSTATREQRLSYEVLAAGPGAALSGDTAAAHFGVRGAVLEPIRVARPRHTTSRAEAREPTLLPPEHVVVLEGIPVVVPARALFDIAGSVVRGAERAWHLDRVERLVNNAITDDLTSGAALFEMLDDMAQRGRAGIKVMRLVLGKHDPDEVAPASGLETRFVQICRRYGLPAMRRQVNLGDGARWIGRVDFVAHDVPLVVEVQSERFHASRIDQQLDSDRFRRLDRAGFEVVTVTDVQVWHDAEGVAAAIRAGRAKAAGRVSAAPPAS